MASQKFNQKDLERLKRTTEATADKEKVKDVLLNSNLSVMEEVGKNLVMEFASYMDTLAGKIKPSLNELKNLSDEELEAELIKLLGEEEVENFKTAFGDHNLHVIVDWAIKMKEEKSIKKVWNFICNKEGPHSLLPTVFMLAPIGNTKEEKTGKEDPGLILKQRIIEALEKISSTPLGKELFTMLGKVTIMRAFRTNNNLSQIEEDFDFLTRILADVGANKAGVIPSMLYLISLFLTGKEETDEKIKELVNDQSFDEGFIEAIKRGIERAEGEGGGANLSTVARAFLAYNKAFGEGETVRLYNKLIEGVRIKGQHEFFVFALKVAGDEVVN